MPAILKVCLILLFAAVFFTQAAGLEAGTIYTYEDEHGNLVFTDTPPTHRKGVKARVFVTDKKAGKKSKGRSASAYDEAIKEIALRYKVEPAIVKAVIRAESNFDPFAVSHKGAEGLMQLMPATAEMLAVANAFDPVSNIEGGTKYLRYLLDKFNGNLKLTLAAYNAGEGAVSRYNGVPPYKETKEYVRKVLAFYENYSALLY